MSGRCGETSYHRFLTGLSQWDEIFWMAVNDRHKNQPKRVDAEEKRTEKRGAREWSRMPIHHFCKQGGREVEVAT